MTAANFLSDAEWRELLLEIHNRRVIPIVGPELVSVSLAAGSPAAPLYRSLAPKLADALGLLGRSPPADTLNHVACQYLLSGGKRKHIYLETAQLLDALVKNDTLPPAALVDLASIRDFDLFIAGTIDHFLSAAIEQERPGFRRDDPRQVIAYDNRRPVDLPDPLGPTLVFHLLGNRTTCPYFAVWEEDHLEFIYKLVQHEAQLAGLFRDLRSRYLLFLGTPFADWVVRFFLFVAKGGRFSDRRKDDFSACLADRPENLGEPLIFFFDQVVGTMKVIPGDPAAFVAELTRRWRAEHDLAADGVEILRRMPAECPRGAVFVSYSHDDLPTVATLVCGLREAGVPVWVDKERLQLGEHYESRLEVAVKSNCSYFLSVISQATESNSERFVHRERRWAAQRHVNGFVFYLPVIVDDSPQPRLEPPEFAQVQCERLPGGVVSQAFAERLRRLIEEYQRAGHPRA